MPRKKPQRHIADIICDQNMDALIPLKIGSFEEIAINIRDYLVDEFAAAGYSPTEIANNVNNILYSDDTESIIYTYANLYQWIHSKQVFSFDKSLMQLLLSQDISNLKISTQIFKTLPVHSFFIETTSNEGIFVGTYSDSHIPFAVLFTVVMNGAKPLSMMFPVNDNEQTIYEIIEARADMERTKPQVLKKISEILAGYFQMIIYLAAINAEITAVNNGAYDATDKPKNNTTSNNNPKQKKQRILVSNVGYRFGSAYRTNKGTHTTGGVHEGSHSSKIPHIRRSHFHSYWTGKRDSDDRQLIVKWINTIFVNSNPDVNDASITTTVHKVE